MAKTEIKAVLFKNFTNEKFVCSWDSVPYTFQAGQEMYVEDWKAEHFAKHLVNRELDKMGQITSNKAARLPLEALAMPTETTNIPIEELLDSQVKEEIETKKKAGRPSKKVVEEEFEGLKDK